MPMKQTGRKVYKSMQGKTVDMDLLRQRNELTPAVGNARVNARGDELGPGGKIIRKKEEVLQGYYEKTNAAPDEITTKRTATVPPVVDETPTKRTTKKVEKDLTDDWVEPDAATDWVEDAEGNFVPKGE
jgi:hypothetical protein